MEVLTGNWSMERKAGVARIPEGYAGWQRRFSAQWRGEGEWCWVAGPPRSSRLQLLRPAALPPRSGPTGQDGGCMSASWQGMEEEPRAPGGPSAVSAYPRHPTLSQAMAASCGSRRVTCP